MSNEITIICVYSKYSSYCQKFLKQLTKLPDVKKICIDNHKIRDYVLNSNTIKLTQVPSLIITKDNENTVYEGDNAFMQLANLIESKKRNEIEKRTKSEQNIKVELEKQLKIKQQQIESERHERYNQRLDLHKQQIEMEFREKEKSIREQAENQIQMEKENFINEFKKNNQKTQLMDSDEDTSENENETNDNTQHYDYDEHKQQRDLHNERMQNHEYELMKAQRQLSENQRRQEKNNSIRGEHDSMNVRMNMAQQKSNAMRSRSNLNELTNLEDILGEDDENDNHQEESLQNTINNSINQGSGNDIMALAQQMQNARDEPDSGNNRGR